MPRLSQYDSRWAEEFDQTRSCVLDSADGWVRAVEHIGGTALPGSIAQPVIDVLAGVDDLNGMEPAATLIEGMFYRRLPLPEWVGGQVAILMEKPRGGPASHRLWLVARQGPLWQRLLALRDHLRDHPADAQRLSQLKRVNLPAMPADEQRYELAKSAYFTALEDQLRASRRLDSRFR